MAPGKPADDLIRIGTLRILDLMDGTLLLRVRYALLETATVKLRCYTALPTRECVVYQVLGAVRDAARKQISYEHWLRKVGRHAPW